MYKSMGLKLTLTAYTLIIYLLIGAPGAFCAQTSPSASVPFSDQIDGRIFNYNRLRPDIATSGRLNEGGVALLAEKGFKTVLDLRTALEGTAAEMSEVEQADINYYNIPIATELPDQQAVAKFSRLLEDPTRGPLLVHCASANRVGTLWALYQITQDVPVELALEEGRTIGMSAGREQQVRESLQN